MRRVRLAVPVHVPNAACRPPRRCTLQTFCARGHIARPGPEAMSNCGNDLRFLAPARYLIAAKSFSNLLETLFPNSAEFFGQEWHGFRFSWASAVSISASRHFDTFERQGAGSDRSEPAPSCGRGSCADSYAKPAV